MKTRADLNMTEGFADLSTDTVGNPCVWENHYQCSCGEEWCSDWSCQCNDRCGRCDAEVEPCESFWIGPRSDELRAQWEDLPEAGMTAHGFSDEGTEGQDRESYSDDQDRNNYTVSE